MLLLVAGSALAQERTVKPNLETWKLRQQALQTDEPLLIQRPAAPVYEVIALRVEFQPDTTRFTTGEGTFSGELYEDGLQPNVDPLPHDAGYFEAHLTFLENYVWRVSNSRTQVNTHLIPEVIRVSQPMGNYSPTGFEAQSDAELVKLAALVQEAWTLASAQSTFDVSGFDPERTAFVLFHAGVGRDLELIGTTLDKTPLDLPSIYFSDESLVRLLDESILSFKGLPVTNTIVMPRTETRRGVNFITDESFLAEFSINGLLAASFFNYLGVPDLFDTETGQSAIGPFGLMDPFGLFAFSGLFPPEPMAWTRAYLGWSDVAVLDDTNNTPSLPAVEGSTAMDIAQARIAEGEYFLVENRQRDVEDDGLVMHIWKDGQVTEQRIQLGDETFDQFSIEGFAGGVVVDVDNYDWALPGAIDEDGTTRNGGLLIWHIDEARIRDGRATNRINSGDVRSIDLEEADSGQDLGTSSAGGFGPQLEFGTPFDYYYEGNPVLAVTGFGNEIALYENRFGPDTYPNSNTNVGTPSYVELRDFSASGPVMSFEYAVIPVGGIEPLALEGCLDALPGAPVFDEHSAFHVTDVNCTSAIVFYRDALSGTYRLVIDEADRAVFTDVQAATPAIYRADDGTTTVTWLTDEALVTRTLGESNDIIRPLPAGFEGRTPTSPVIRTEELVKPTYSISFEGTNTVLRAQERVQAIAVNQVGEVLTVASGRESAINNSMSDVVYAVGTNGVQQVLGERVIWSLNSERTIGTAVFGNTGLIPRPATRQLDVLGVNGQTVIDATPFCEAEDPLNERALFTSGHPILASCGARVLGFNASGSVANHFNRRVIGRVRTGFASVQSANGENESVALFATDEGLVYALETASGEVLPGFPLKAGLSVAATPLVHDGVLYAQTERGTITAWRVDDDRFARSSTYAHGNRIIGVVDNPSALALVDSGDLVPEETYNWPNPIIEGQTWIRVLAGPDATIDVKIVDMGGALVDTITMMPNGIYGPREHLWQTDAPSGVYFAQVQVRGTNQTHIIKMAIVR
ncbi:MAG: hypothetical protein RhofKO_14760 [Rhodothermales bacterium]